MYGFIVCDTNGTLSVQSSFAAEAAAPVVWIEFLHTIISSFVMKLMKLDLYFKLHQGNFLKF